MVNYAGQLIQGPKTSLINVTFVPEPSTICLSAIGIGFVGLFAARKGRGKK